jgi:cobalamin-dependent methionine synthase I
VYLENWARNAYLGIELKRILQRFQDAGFAALLLKGASLSEAVYHDSGSRRYNDLDILVPQKDLDRALGMLITLGYLNEDAAEFQEHYRNHHHHLAPMIHREKSVVGRIALECESTYPC